MLSRVGAPSFVDTLSGKTGVSRGNASRVLGCRDKIGGPSRDTVPYVGLIYRIECEIVDSQQITVVSRRRQRTCVSLG